MAYEAALGLVALTRFGYGPRGDGDVTIAASDPRGFLRAELMQPGIALLGGPALPSTKVAAQQFFKDQADRQAERQRAVAATEHARQYAELVKVSPVFARAALAEAHLPAAAPAIMTAGEMAPATMMSLSAAATAQIQPPPAAKPPPSPEQIIFRDECLARIRRAIEARAGFAERLVDFWSNHFCVSANKGGIARVTCGAFEREAIRPYVLGRFADMLLAVETHPAMLHFLDNAQSVGPKSKAGANGRRGLNENLGREIMELHTLGVGGGYTQADVTNLARIITGWTYVGQGAKLGEPGTFVFNAAAHEPGPIELLGMTYPEDGIAQGRAALLDIARRPQTARFITGKFARHFLGDAPPRTLLDRLARVFHDTDGDLRALSLALIDAPEAWNRKPLRVRNPYEFMIGTHRLLQRLPEEPGALLGPLNTMGMSLWTPPGPNGFSDQTSAWATPEGMKLRLDYSAQVGQRLREPPNPSDLLEALCGGAPSPETRLAVAHAESRQQGLALLLMSPEMQRS